MTEAKSIEDENAKTYVEKDGLVQLPTGNFSLKQLRAILNTLPFEIDFIDETDHFAYFTDGENRIYPQSRAILGQSIVECYLSEEQEAIQKILDSFHAGAASHYEQWFPDGKRICYINFYALRDIDGTYLGMIRFTGDITRIQGFRGVRTFHNSDKSE